MKHRSLFSLLLVLFAVLACQSTSKSPASNQDIPTQLPLATAQSTLLPTLTEAQSNPTTPLAIEIIDKFGVPMVLVPVGDFVMGSNNGSENEKPVHTVTLDSFYIDIYEVTNARYQSCVESGGCTLPERTYTLTRSSYYDDPQFDNYPVTSVTWDQANSYCKWRDARLPTEAEWEKAARGTDERTYPWGEESPAPDLLNFNMNVGDTTEVGNYLENISPYGLYDMAGNVSEWVNDWYDKKYYEISPLSNPLGPDQSNFRPIRGGSWEYDEFAVRTTFRDNIVYNAHGYSIGFRCVRNVTP